MRIEPLGRPGEIGAVHIGDETDRQVRIAERTQRAIGHFRPEIGAADPDIDDVADSFAAVSGPGAGPHLARERGHPVEDGMDLGHDILAVDENLLAAFGAQRHMQDGAVLADVDLLAREHRVAPRGDAARPGKLDEQTNGLVGDPVLGIVEEKSRRLHAEALAAPRIACKQGAELQVLHALVMRKKRLPFRRGRQRSGAAHVISPVWSTQHM